MGCELGRKIKHCITADIRFYQSFWLQKYKIGWKKTINRLVPYMQITQRQHSDVWEKLRGIAQGSHTRVEDLFTINAEEVVAAWQTISEHCSTLLILPAASATRRIILAHNEHDVWNEVERMYVVRARPKNKPHILALGYGAWLPTYGINSAGIAFASDTNTATDQRVGIPPYLVGDKILQQRTLRAAVNSVRNAKRANGYTFVIGSANGRGVVMETTAARTVFLKLTPFNVHTNYYQSTLRKFEQDVRTYARFRAARLQELMTSHFSEFRQFNPRSIKKILADHLNYPEAVCFHGGETAGKKEGEQTIAMLLMEPTEGRMLVIHGNPCNGHKQVFSL